MSNLKSYVKRESFDRFQNLKSDEKIVAHWALAIKELIKFNYSGLLEYDVDTIETEQQMRCLSSDKKGGINWINYMFSDKYNDEDKKIDDKGEIFAALSICEAIEKYYKFAGDWPGVVCLLGKWYEKNIHTYQSDPPGMNTGNHPGRKFYDCPVFKTEDMKVGDDCTSFCFACIQLYWDLCMKDSDPDIHKELIEYPIFNIPRSAIWGNPNQEAAKNMEKYGFEIIKYSPDELQPWDMVMGSKDFGASHGHGEIYVGPYKGKIVEFGWGSVHDGQGRSGMPAGTSYKDGEYSLIFRIKGIKKYTEEEVKELIDQYA